MASGAERKAEIEEERGDGRENKIAGTGRAGGSARTYRHRMSEVIHVLYRNN